MPVNSGRAIAKRVRLDFWEYIRDVLANPLPAQVWQKMAPEALVPSSCSRALDGCSWKLTEGLSFIAVGVFKLKSPERWGGFSMWPCLIPRPTQSG